MKSGPEFKFLAFQKLWDQTSGLDHHKTQTKTYILAPGAGLFYFLPSLPASRVWMKILPLLMFLFAELKLCHISKWARASTHGLQRVLYAVNFPCFIKCLHNKRKGRLTLVFMALALVTLLQSVSWLVLQLSWHREAVGPSDLLWIAFQGLYHCCDGSVWTGPILSSSSVSWLTQVHSCWLCCTQYVTSVAQGLPAPGLLLWKQR